MNVDHRLKVLDRHLGEALVTQDAGIVDEDVDPSPCVHGVFDHAFCALTVRHRAAVGKGFTAGGFDLGNHLLGRLGATTGAVHRPA